MASTYSSPQMRKQSRLMGQVGLLMWVAVQERDWRNKRLEAKRLIQKLFKNSGVGVIGMKKRLYLGFFF